MWVRIPLRQGVLDTTLCHGGIKIIFFQWHFHKIFRKQALQGGLCFLFYQQEMFVIFVNWVRFEEKWQIFMSKELKSDFFLKWNKLSGSEKIISPPPLLKVKITGLFLTSKEDNISKKIPRTTTLIPLIII